MHDDYLILCSLDVDDLSMNTPEIRNRIGLYRNRVVAYYGVSDNKTQAINRDIVFAGDWDILCNHSDDMWFIKKGFDLDILQEFSGYHGVVNFVDRHRPETMTYAMMSRSYFILDGFIYHPDFISVYSDDFQKELAKSRKCFKFVNKIIYEHRHWRWGLDEKDSLQEKTEHEDNYTHDRAIRDRLRKEYNLI